MRARKCDDFHLFILTKLKIERNLFISSKIKFLSNACIGLNIAEMKKSENRSKLTNRRETKLNSILYDDTIFFMYRPRFIGL